MKLDQMITKVVVGFPKITLLLFAVISIGAASFISSLERDPTPYLLPKTHESRVNLEKLRENYTGSNDGIIVLLDSDKSIFNQATLTRVKSLTTAFENIHLITNKDRDDLLTLGKKSGSIEVQNKIRKLVTNPIDSDTWMQIDEIKEAHMDSSIELEIVNALDLWMHKLSPILEVTSLANTDNILGGNGTLDIKPVLEQIPTTDQELDQLENEIRSNVLFENLLYSNDGKSTSIILELATSDDDSNNQFILYNQVKNILEIQVPGPENHYVAGIPVVTGAMGKVMETDTQKLFPLVILIVITCLFITFRGIKGILVPLAVVILSLIVTLGLKAFFNVPLNIITTTLPVFILSIGVADGIHMFSEYRDNLLLGYDKISSVKRTLSHLTMPVVMTSITTAVAFYAISMTEIVQLKHFGIFVSIGTLVAMVYSLFFIPAVLVLLPEKTKAMEKTKGFGKTIKTESKIEKVYTQSLIKITQVFLKQPVVTTMVASLLFTISLFGASKVLVDNNNAKYFLEDSNIYISSEKLNKDASGSSLINILVSSESQPDNPSAEPFKQSGNLIHVDNLVEYVKEQSIVGKVLGLTELVKRINFVLNDEDEAFNVVPQINRSVDSEAKSKHLISQLLLLYENGGGDTLSDFTDTGYTRLNIPVVLQTNSSHEIYQLSQKIKTYVAQYFPNDIKVEISGSANVTVAATDEIVSGQMTSLFVSLGVVLAMLFFTFRKASYAAIAMVPLGMTITINFGIMGFLAIPLDIGTAIISSIVIGIGVDYSIHYLSRLKSNLESGMSFSDALINTVSHSGKAIVSNAITVGSGFVALWFSQLTPLIIMGWMITVTMLVSAASTLILIPVLIVLHEKRFKANEQSKNKQSQLTFQPQKS